jgi:hypothetical protein
VFCHALNSIPDFVVVVQIRCYPIMVSQQPFPAMYATWQWAPMKVCARNTNPMMVDAAGTMST